MLTLYNYVPNLNFIIRIFRIYGFSKFIGITVITDEIRHLEIRCLISVFSSNNVVKLIVIHYLAKLQRLTILSLQH